MTRDDEFWIDLVALHAGESSRAAADMLRDSFRLDVLAMEPWWMWVSSPLWSVVPDENLLSHEREEVMAAECERVRDLHAKSLTAVKSLDEFQELMRLTTQLMRSSLSFSFGSMLRNTAPDLFARLLGPVADLREAMGGALSSLVDLRVGLEHRVLLDTAVAGVSPRTRSRQLAGRSVTAAHG